VRADRLDRRQRGVTLGEGDADTFLRAVESYSSAPVVVIRTTTYPAFPTAPLGNPMRRTLCRPSWPVPRARRGVTGDSGWSANTPLVVVFALRGLKTEIESVQLNFETKNGQHRNTPETRNLAPVPP
jgi:hypothetical protein